MPEALQVDPIPPAGRELELCLQLQASLEAAFRKRLAGRASSGGEWGEAFFCAFDSLPPNQAPPLETVYMVAARALNAQSRAGLDRPLAHRILIDPEAFLMSLLAVLEVLDLKY